MVVVVVVEAPDDAVLTRFAMALSMTGNMRTKPLKAFPEAAYREIVATLVVLGSGCVRRPQCGLAKISYRDETPQQGS